MHIALGFFPLPHPRARGKKAILIGMAGYYLFKEAEAEGKTLEQYALGLIDQELRRQDQK